MPKTSEEIRYVFDDKVKKAREQFTQLNDTLDYSRKLWYSKEEILEAIGDRIRVRGITPECQVINAKANEKDRIIKELFGDE